MKHALRHLILFFFLISCAKKNERNFQPVMPTEDTMHVSDTSHKTYLALGDSYTTGTSVAAAESFPMQAARLLRKEHVDIENPEIIAVNGWTTANLLNTLNTNSPKKNSYTLVTLLIGVNNQHQGGSLEEYESHFAELLARAISYAGNMKGHVFVLSIPDYSVTPFASGLNTTKIASEIDAFNGANKSISLNAGVHYIDITSISREVKNDLSLVAGDGLHPSGFQYRKWSELLAPAMLKEIL